MWFVCFIFRFFYFCVDYCMYLEKAEKCWGGELDRERN